MATVKPLIMRGLYIPDANFTSPVGDCWTTGGEVSDADVTFRPAQGDDYTPGTGRYMRVNIDGCSMGATGDGVTSAFSPHGVAAGHPTSSLMKFWVGVVARTVNVSAGNTSTVLYARMREYDEDGIVGNSSGFISMRAGIGAAGALFKYSADWGLFTAHCSLTSSANKTHYRLELAFVDDSVSGSNDYVDIDSVCVGLPIDTTTGYDQLSSFYDASPSDAQSTMHRVLSNRNSRNPHSFVQNPENAQLVSVNFPYLSLADKQVIKQCEQWHNGAPLDDIDSSAGLLTNRGNKQPVVWVMDRPEFKRAFYAYMSPFNPVVSNNGWYPSTGAIHAANLTFQEWL